MPNYSVIPYSKQGCSMSILKFLPIFIGGMLLCGCESGTVMTEPEIETLDQEISRVENEDVVSMTDKDNCFYVVPIVPEF